MQHYFTDNQDLKSEMRTISYEKKGKLFTFFSDNGVFSKSKIDYGSQLLVEAILSHENAVSSILDVGCGYGFIGIVLASFFDSSVLLSDVNNRALSLASKNLLQNKVSGDVVNSNCYANIVGSFDLVVSNPPIRAGKSVVLDILNNASNHLHKSGSLWFVIRKDQGVKSICKLLSDCYSWQVILKSKGFYVICAKIR